MKSALRVVQLNIGSLAEPNWRARRVEVSAWLDHLDPDLVCLQEVWGEHGGATVVDWLIEQQPESRWSYAFGGIEVPSPDNAAKSVLLGNAIMSRWPIQSQETFFIPRGGAPGMEHKSVLLAARTAGVDVFSTHLPGRAECARIRRTQVKEIDAIAHSWRDTTSSLPPVLCGDFNCEPDSDEIRFLCGLTPIDGVDTAWQESWRAAGRTDPGYTAHPANPYFASFNLYARRIDYVFVGETALARRPQEGFPGRILRSTLAFDHPLTDTLASDHYGVCVDIEWPAKIRG